MGTIRVTGFEQGGLTRTQAKSKCLMSQNLDPTGLY